LTTGQLRARTGPTWWTAIPRLCRTG